MSQHSEEETSQFIHDNMKALNAASDHRRRNGYLRKNSVCVSVGVRQIYEFAKQREDFKMQHGPVRVLFKDGKPVPRG